MRRKRILIFFSVLSLLFTALGVQAKSPYKALLKAWTRHDIHYGREDLFAQFTWSATYLSDAFTQGRLAEYSRKMKPTPEQRDVYWRQELEPYTHQPTFFVAFYTLQKKWNALEDQKDPIWHIVLHTQTQNCAPSEIRRIKTVSSEERYFFPYLEGWDVPYLILFPVSCPIAAGESFSLTMDGLYGHSELKW